MQDEFTMKDILRKCILNLAFDLHDVVPSTSLIVIVKSRMNCWTGYHLA